MVASVRIAPLDPFGPSRNPRTGSIAAPTRLGTSPASFKRLGASAAAKERTGPFRPSRDGIARIARILAGSPPVMGIRSLAGFRRRGMGHQVGCGAEGRAELIGLARWHGPPRPAGVRHDAIPYGTATRLRFRAFCRTPAPFSGTIRLAVHRPRLFTPLRRTGHSLTGVATGDALFRSLSGTGRTLRPAPKRRPPPASERLAILPSGGDGCVMPWTVYGIKS